LLCKNPNVNSSTQQLVNPSIRQHLRYFFHIAYKGTNYRGWQRQPNTISVQEVIENEVNRLLKMNTFIVGCGRTDAGVHASQFFFHLDVESEWQGDLKFKLNKALPDDIAVHDIIQVDDKAHAQFHATERTYDYHIHTHKMPFLSDVSALYEEKLDIEKMKIATAILLKHNDFYAFCKTPDKHNHTICHIKNAELFLHENDKIQFRITANRFLRGMIRIIVDRLVEVGKGNWSVEKFEYHLNSKERPQFTNFAPPQGLFLSKVVYPFIR